MKHKWNGLVVGALALALTVVGPMGTPVFADGYSDIKTDSWERDAVMNMAEKGIVSGYSDGTFRAQNSLTRAEVVKLINKLCGFSGHGTEPSNGSFKDVAVTFWASKDIGIAVEKGYISGFPDGTFRPNSPVTYEQFSKMLALSLSLPDSLVSKETQTPIFENIMRTTPKWAHPYVNRMLGNGLIDISGDHGYRAEAAITRGVAVVAFHRHSLLVTKLTEAGTGGGKPEPALPVIPPVAPSIGQPVTPPVIPSVTPPVVPPQNVLPQDVEKSLRSALELLKTDVYKELKTPLHHQAHGLMVDAITRYLADHQYVYGPSIDQAKAIAKQMESAEYSQFKNAITGNIPVRDISALNDFFKVID